MALLFYLATLALLFSGWLKFLPDQTQIGHPEWLAATVGFVIALMTLFDVVVLKSRMWRALDRFAWMILFSMALSLLWVIITFGFQR